MCKATEMEDFPSRRGGTLADNRRTPLDVKSGQMFWWNRKFLPKKNCLLTTPRLMLYSTNSAALSRPIRPRRGGRAAECGGLLNLPALFVLANFHVFSVLYAALSCTHKVPFAG